MPFADRLNNLFQTLVHHITYPTFECFVFLWRDLALNCADGIIHLVIDSQEHVKNVFRGVWIFKQGRLRGVDVSIHHES